MTRDTRIAAVGAFVIVATFVAGKTARDATFLRSFDVTLLPTFAAVGAFATIPLVLVFSRRITAAGPARVVPALHGVSAALLVVEWIASAPWPQIAGAATYFHLAGLGTILVSGFWSAINERFDPRTAKRNIARIGFGATLGGIAGGFVAQFTALWLPTRDILLVVAVMQLASGALVHVIGARRAEATEELGDAWEGMRVVAHTPMLRAIAIVVVLVATSAGLLDYAFKVQIARANDGALGALGLYYAVINIASAVAQAVVVGPLIARLGAGRSAAVLPAILAGFSLSGFAIPAAAFVVIARGAEMVTRNTVYRASLELLMSPLAAHDKRSAKALLDVGAERVGDMLGAQLVGLLLAWPEMIVPGAGAVAMVALVVALGLPRAYKRALAQRLSSAAPPVLA